MAKTVTLTMPLPEPLALLDATLIFIYRLFMARHPELFAAPGACVLPRSPGENNARLVMDAVRNLYLALESYGIEVSMDPDGRAPAPIDDDIPF